MLVSLFVVPVPVLIKVHQSLIYRNIVIYFSQVVLISGFHFKTCQLKRYFFIFLLSFLVFSMYYKFSVIKMNFFINFFLVIVIMVTKLTCLRKLFILYISRSTTFLHSIVKTYNIFQSSRTILLLYTSEISIFSNCFCFFCNIKYYCPQFFNVESPKKTFIIIFY